MISKKELINDLYILKDMLNNLDYNKLGNIIFYNFDSYIKYINIQCCTEDNNSVEEILSKIEPFIPFEFDERTIDLLISTVVDNYDPDSFQRLLVKRAKVDFINAIKTADTKTKWNRIIRKCEYILEHRVENSIMI